MKLYELNRGDYFQLLEDPAIPLDAEEGIVGEEYKYTHVDGMYAPVVDCRGNRVYFAAWTEVKKVEKA